MIYLTANDWNLGERMDLMVVADSLGPGQVFFLDDAARNPEYRSKVLEAIRGKIPVVAGGGTMSRFFEPFWRSIDETQQFLFVGTGICWPYGSNEAYPLHPRHIDRRSAFRGPINPPGFDSLSFIPPPGILYGVERNERNRLLSVIHPHLIDPKYQSCLARRVADHIGIELIECDNRSDDEDLYATASLVLTSRLHGAVMAAGNGIPCFALSRDHKLDWFCSETKLRKFSLMDFSGADLSEEALELISTAPAPDISAAASRLEAHLDKLARTFF